MGNTQLQLVLGCPIKRLVAFKNFTNVVTLNQMYTFLHFVVNDHDVFTTVL